MFLNNYQKTSNSNHDVDSVVAVMDAVDVSEDDVEWKSELSVWSNWVSLPDRFNNRLQEQFNCVKRNIESGQATNHFILVQVEGVNGGSNGCCVCH